MQDQGIVSPMQMFEGPYTKEHLEQVAKVFGIGAASQIMQIHLHDGRLEISYLDVREDNTGENPKITDATEITRTYYMVGGSSSLNYSETRTPTVIGGKRLASYETKYLDGERK